MTPEVAISVKNVSKTFRIPHEKVSSIRGAFVGMLSSFHLPFLRGGKGGVSYEEFKALDDVSFEVMKGEFFGIIGRNGSGKSTLLKILAGIYEADTGTVRTNGLISPFLELGIGFNPELSGRDNIYLNATVLGLTKKEIDEKFDSIVEFSELGRFIDQKLKNYSSGMQVRLAFSVSIHANRDILLMDEVLAVGDSNFQAKCLEEFKMYRGEGKTVILVTHDINVVRQYCDRAVLLRSGRIMSFGRTVDVCNLYLAENLSDKHAQLSRELGKELRDFGNKDIEILNVSPLDDAGETRNVFYAGETMKIRIEYTAHKEVLRPHFGISIRDSNGKLLLSTNHLRKPQFIEKIEKGEVGSVSVVIRKLPLLSGDYTMGVLLYTDKIRKVPEPIHHVDDAIGFSVINREPISDDGLIYLDCEWELHQ